MASFDDDPAVPTSRRPSRRKKRKSRNRSGLRWQLIPAVFMGFFGAFGVLGVVIKGGAMTYYNLKLGPIADSGGVDRAFDNIALTGANVGYVCLMAIAGWAGLTAARLWMRKEHSAKEHSAAVVATMITLAALGFAGNLSQSKSNRLQRPVTSVSSQPLVPSPL